MYLVVELCKGSELEERRREREHGGGREREREREHDGERMSRGCTKCFHDVYT